MADEPGFLGRWSRRKQLAREGLALPQDPAAAPLPAGNPPSMPVSGKKPPEVHATPSPDAINSGAIAEPDPETAPLTLADTQALDTQSDFTRFMARGVAPEVRNAAMKKLFADPHFNVMDMMDTYVDDYSQSTPIPESVLRQMASAQFLDLFDERKDAEAAAAAAAASEQPAAALQAGPAPEPLVTRDVADAPPGNSVAQSRHDDPDMRLQPDDAAGPQGPRPGAG